MADLPELPRSWRPIGVRIAGWALGLMLLLVTTVAWLTFPADVRAAFTLSQRISAVSLGLIIWAAFYAVFVLAVAIHTPIGLRAVAREWLGWRGRSLEFATLATGIALAALGWRAVAGVVLA